MRQSASVSMTEALYEALVDAEKQRKNQVVL